MLTVTHFQQQTKGPQLIPEHNPLHADWISAEPSSNQIILSTLFRNSIELFWYFGSLQKKNFLMCFSIWFIIEHKMQLDLF